MRIDIVIKHLFCLLFATLCVVGCKDSSVDAAKGEPSNLITATISQTRALLGSKIGEIYPVYWSSEDRIVVNGAHSETISIDETNPSKATFCVNPAPAYPRHITYPYCASTSAEQPVVAIPAEQTYAEGTFSEGCAAMCGYADSDEAVELSHLTTILRIPIKASEEGVVLQSVVVNSETAIAGEFEVDCSAVTIAPTAQSKKSITYTLLSDFSLSTTTERVFHISMAATDVESCTIEFVETSGRKMVATWNPDTPLAKGVVREFDCVTYERDGVTALQSLKVEEDEFIIYYKKIYGNIRYSDGSPIAGVAVSDGFQVVESDSEGYYELNGVTSDSWYIYCSLPADVEVPINELGQPCFFKKYPASSPRYDFTFERLEGGKEQEFALFALADTQPGNTTQLERFAIQAAPEIKSYSKSLGLPCYGIVLGDLVNSKPYLMESMRGELAASKIGMPVFAVMGNHDHITFNSTRPAFPDERSSNYMLKIQRGFEECFGPVNYSFNRGDVHIIGMRDVKNKDNISSGNYARGFTTEQYEWLKQDLALVPKDKMVVFCVHIPLYNTGKLGDGSYVQEVLTLLDQYSEAHILSGHTHYMNPYDHIWNNTGYKIYEHCIASTRQDMMDSNIHRDGTPCGYAVLKAKDNSFVDWYYKGFPYGMNSRDDQMRIYRGNAITGADIVEPDTYGTKGYYQFGYSSDMILANIYTSDPSWTVEVYEDGVYSGDMTYFYNISGSGFDSLQGDGSYENPRRVKDGLECSRDWWAIGVLFGRLGSDVNNNYNTSHTMWKYTLKNPDAKHIEVRAIDSHSKYVYSCDTVLDGSEVGYEMYDPQYNPTIE